MGASSSCSKRKWNDQHELLPLLSIEMVYPNLQLLEALILTQELGRKSRSVEIWKSRRTDSGQLRRWQACGGWRTQAGGICQAMRVRPTCRSPGALGRQKPLKVAGCRDASRPARFAG